MLSKIRKHEHTDEKVVKAIMEYEGLKFQPYENFILCTDLTISHLEDKEKKEKKLKTAQLQLK
jgi:hypothetical protein